MNLIKLFFNITADIYDEVYPSVRALGLDTECLGGGRIEHFPRDKLLKVYGHSTVSLLKFANLFFGNDSPHKVQQIELSNNFVSFVNHNSNCSRS